MALTRTYTQCDGIGSANRDWLMPWMVIVRGLEE